MSSEGAEMGKTCGIWCMMCFLILALCGCGVRQVDLEGMEVWEPGWERVEHEIYKGEGVFLGNICAAGGRLLYSVADEEEKTFYYVQDIEPRISIPLLTVDNTTAAVMDCWLDQEGNAYFIFWEKLGEEEDPEENLYLRKYDFQGETADIRKLNDFFRGEEDDCSLWKVRTDAGGNILVYSGLAYLLLDPEGNVLKEDSMEENFREFAYAGGNSALLGQREGYRDVFSWLNLDSGRRKKISDIPDLDSIGRICYHGECTLVATSLGLYGSNAGKGPSQMLFKWTDFGILGENIRCIYREGDAFHCVTQQDDGIYDITCVKPENFPERTELVLGCLGEWGFLRGAVARFNSSNPDILLKVVDYYEGDELSAVNKMYNAILAGEGPDIIQFGSMYADDAVLAEQGLLEDLNGYLDQSVIVGREDLVAPLYRALQIGGALYMLPTNFTVEALATRKEWAKEGLLELAAEMPGMGCNVSREVLLDLFAAYCLRSGEEYARNRGMIADYLKAAAVIPEDAAYSADDTMRRDGKILYDAGGINEMMDYLYKKAVWGGQFTLTGIPGAEGNGMAFLPVNCFGISARSGHKEEAWRFLESFFSEEWHDGITPDWRFSADGRMLEKQFQKSMEIPCEEDEDGNIQREYPVQSYQVSAGEVVDVYAARQGDVDEMKEIIDGICLVRRDNSAVYRILQEEASGYFAGDKSLEETVELIVNRLNLLFGERNS